MSVSILDVQGDPLLFDQTNQMDGIQYLLTFTWSDRESCWYMDVGDQNGNEICSGVRLVVNFPLLRRFVSSTRPPGEIVAVDIGGTGQDIQVPAELGDRVLLVYISADDPLLAL